MSLPFQTGRLRIDDLRPEDAGVLFGYRSDGDVARYQGWRPTTVDEARDFIERNARTIFNSGDSWYQLAMRIADSDELIGDLGVHFVGENGHQVEIGGTVAPGHQQRGLGTEGVRALLDLLFVELGKHRVYASVDPRNTASIALLERVGFRREAHFRQSLLFKGEWVDDVVYAMLGSEWAELRS